MKSEIHQKFRLFGVVWIFLLTLHFLSCFEYFEKSPSALLLFIQKDDIPKRISGRGIVLVPQDKAKQIAPGTIILSYKELVEMQKSGHVQSDMMGLYYYNVDEHYIGSGRSSVNEIISWGIKTTNRNKESARIVLIPTSNYRSDLFELAFNNINRTLSYDYTMLTQFLQLGRINRDSTAILILFEDDWYKQGTVVDLMDFFRDMNYKDKLNSKFYFISDVLGGIAKHSSKIGISSDNIEDGFKVTGKSPANQLKPTNVVLPDLSSQEGFGGVSNGRQIYETPYFRESIMTAVPALLPTTSSIPMIPWLGEQMDSPFFGIQTQSVMVPVNLQDIMEGPITARRSFFPAQGMSKTYFIKS